MGNIADRGDRPAPQPANDLAGRDRCRYRVISAAPRAAVARSLSTATDHAAPAERVIALRRTRSATPATPGDCFESLASASRTIA
jgi:hypothetical protein